MKDYVMFVERSNVWVDNNMGYYHEFIEAWGLTSKGRINEIKDSNDIYHYLFIERIKKDVDWKEFYSHTKHFVLTTVYIRENHLELYNSMRKRGRPAKNVMKLMAQEIGGDEDENI